MPEPRPFVQPEKQRPKLANVIMLIVFVPYGLVLSLIGAGGIVALFAFAWKVFSA